MSMLIKVELHVEQHLVAGDDVVLVRLLSGTPEAPAHRPGDVLDEDGAVVGRWEWIEERP